MKPARTPLPEGAPFLIRACRTCGQEFPTQRGYYCSPLCQMRAWRAVVKLRGTHDGAGRRLKAG